MIGAESFVPGDFSMIYMVDETRIMLFLLAKVSSLDISQSVHGPGGPRLALFDGFVTALGIITLGLTVLQPDKFPIMGWGLFCGFYLGVMEAAMLGLPLLGVDLSYEDSLAIRLFPLLLLSVEQHEKLGIKTGCCSAKGGDDDGDPSGQKRWI